MIRPACLVLLVSIATAPPAHAQAAAEPSRIRVFIDCTNTPCDQDFFRTEIAFVDHVRDRQNADVHVLLTGQSTASGGREVTFNFFGQGRHAALSYPAITQTFVVAASDDDVRRGIARVISLGLVPYVLQSGPAPPLRVTAQPSAPGTTTLTRGDDPWNRWSFRTNLNGNSSGEQSSKSFSINTNLNANRTTDQTKINLNARFNYRESRFTLPDGTHFTAPNRNTGVNGLFVKSLDGHWSTGLRANWNSSTFDNSNWSMYAAPAVEWDLYPYAESTQRLLTVNYSVGLRSWDYREETIFGKLEETRAAQAAEVTLSLRQRWGTAGASVEVASFIPDLSKNHASMYGDLSLNVVRGLSLNLNANFESIRDQIALPRAEATTEEVLVNLRQLATSYRYFVFFGVSYTFGSIFSPVVNPRFSGS